ncbi:hypothetical protein C8F01DRAFT_1121772 [Mycena amicta]|nr:hypothetical protein C8F01DRAFT_1121772 [Mycena amicta]
MPAPMGIGAAPVAMMTAQMTGTTAMERIFFDFDDAKGANEERKGMERAALTEGGTRTGLRGRTNSNAPAESEEAAYNPGRTALGLAWMGTRSSIPSRMSRCAFIFSYTRICSRLCESDIVSVDQHSKTLVARIRATNPHQRSHSRGCRWFPAKFVRPTTRE